MRITHPLCLAIAATSLTGCLSSDDAEEQNFQHLLEAASGQDMRSAEDMRPAVDMRPLGDMRPAVDMREESPCERKVCHNGGTCEETGDVATCSCKRGFSGDGCSLCDAALGYSQGPKAGPPCVPPLEHATCEDAASKLDGEGYYYLSFQGDVNQPWKAYCALLSGSSSSYHTYIPLPHTYEANHFTRTAQDESGVVYPVAETFYQMVRFQKPNLILSTDMRFARSVSYCPAPGDACDDSVIVPYGVVHAERTDSAPPDAYKSLPKLEEVIADLRGTPFAFASEVGPGGSYPSPRTCPSQGTDFATQIGEDRQVVILNTESDVIAGFTTTVEPSYGLSCEPADASGPPVAAGGDPTIAIEYHAPVPIDLIHDFPKTCAQAMASQSPMVVKGKGEYYTLYVDHDVERPWIARCRKDDGHKEFLPLRNRASSFTAAPQDRNFEEDDSNVCASIKQLEDMTYVASKVRYEEVRVEPHTMYIDISDDSDIDGHYYEQVHVDTPPLGFSGDIPDYGELWVSAPSTAPASVMHSPVTKPDLRGTPFQFTQDILGYQDIFAPQQCGGSIMFQDDSTDMGKKWELRVQSLGPVNHQVLAPIRRAYFGRAEEPALCPTETFKGRKSTDTDHALRLKHIGCSADSSQALGCTLDSISRAER